MDLPGANIYLYSNLPVGSGLSSSAALEVLTGHILTRGALEREEDLVDLALLSQKAENEFVGVNCGIMDQFSIALSKEGSALLLDTRSLEYRPVPLDLSPWRLTVMDTASPRSLAGSAFNERREQSARARDIIATRRPLEHLAGAREDELNYIEDDLLRRRARHVITEEKRVMEAVSALERDDLETFGKLLNRSHLSLRDDYEVTGPDLDSLVEAAWDREECLGARMTGAGFGGCAIALVHEDGVDAFRASVTERYRKERDREANIFDVRAGSPAGEFVKGAME
jgi:galactokinase